ncbi:hypothetical protein LTR66_016396, partial [Elasticomyces elasticus]
QQELPDSSERRPRCIPQLSTEDDPQALNTSDDDDADSAITVIPTQQIRSPENSTIDLLGKRSLTAIPMQVHSSPSAPSSPITSRSAEHIQMFEIEHKDDDEHESVYEDATIIPAICRDQ